MKKLKAMSRKEPKYLSENQMDTSGNLAVYNELLSIN